MAIGVLTLTNNLALEVLEIEYGIDDYVIYKFSNDIKARRGKLYTTVKGRSYFKVRGTRYYLDEFMKVGN